ncbi:hypothetical protein MRGR3_2379 [Staphylococcus aureus subsp. aureus MRGR3]|nr:hypothetical protein MRGR3_2379 [Staphylococcus aureus subsp. aureus MRGR3]
MIISVSQSNNYHFLLITNSHSYIIVSVSQNTCALLYQN